MTSNKLSDKINVHQKEFEERSAPQHNMAHINTMFTLKKHLHSQPPTQPSPTTTTTDNDKGVVWVNKRYIPNELRSTAPVPRHKFLNNPTTKRRHGNKVEWMKPIIDSPVSCYKRGENEYTFHKASPAKQCQEWSTLRQMLPSKGTASIKSPPQWGINSPDPPSTSFGVKRHRGRFPIINSSMTSYADAMHVTNRLFTFH